MKFKGRRKKKKKKIYQRIPMEKSIKSPNFIYQLCVMAFRMEGKGFKKNRKKTAW